MPLRVGATAFVLERVAYRPLRKRNAPRLTYLISAIGASYFLFNLAGKEFGRYTAFIPTAAVIQPEAMPSLFAGSVSSPSGS